VSRTVFACRLPSRDSFLKATLVRNRPDRNHLKGDFGAARLPTSSTTFLIARTIVGTIAELCMPIHKPAQEIFPRFKIKTTLPPAKWWSKYLTRREKKRTSRRFVSR